MGRIPKEVVADNKRLMEEWDFHENGKANLDPTTIGTNSHEKASWICKTCNHHWMAEIKARNHGNGCPACGRKKQIETLNRNLLLKKGSLQDNNPELAAEWHPTANLPLTPSDVLETSQKLIAWKCRKCGYVWKQRVSVRSRGCGCPACAGKAIFPGVNDLATINPYLALEWHPSLNNGLEPSQVTAGSGKRAWWKCRVCGNEWQASIASRNSGKGCSNCFYSQQVSFQEKTVCFYVRKIFSNVVDNYSPQWLSPREIDIFIPAYNIGIEYDGAEWHKNPTKDAEKDCLCKEKGIDIIHIREPLCPPVDLDEVINLKSRSIESLEEGIAELIVILNEKAAVTTPDIEINVLADTVPILEMIKMNVKEKSLAETYPELAKEWDYEANYPLRPEQFSPVSGKSVFWKCPLGHSYRARIANRKNGNGCPFCRGRKVIKGFNDIASLYPLLAKEWDDTRNTLKPSEVTPHSNKKVFWKCENDHFWKASINNRVNGRGCPYCANRKVWEGYNDLASCFPELLKEWDYEKNGNTSPKEVLATSSKKYWWRCKMCAHEWLTEVRVRARGNGCPNCARTKNS